MEIVRYWNKLNFMIRRTLQTINQLVYFDEIAGSELKASYLYASYRVKLENVKINEVKAELEQVLGFSKEFNQFLNKLKTFNWNRALKGKDPINVLSLEEAIPTFFINHLRPVMALNFIQKNVHIMNAKSRKIDFTVRINTLLADKTISDIITSFQSDLLAEKIPSRQDSNIKELFHINPKNKPGIIQSKWYESGHLTIQDKGSAAISDIFSPQSNDLIGDLCAAPGQKTSFIAQKLRNTGQIIALDFHTQRMKQMKRLIKHLGVINTHLINGDSINSPFRPELQFDWILLDAPCTGSGTFDTNPELKWRQSPSFLKQNSILQEKLLDSAIRILKPKAILIYSTCSLYPEEGEYQITKVLDRLKPLELPDWFAPSYKVDDKLIKGTGRLFPAIHYTQGFFIGKFEKKE